ncbi:hypothetical protein HELRODRAFT_82735, partial [Helobdella robusta]|uniref:BHLH domain-containing protein n=1 Tax=Helobdella robusta TaxID=6412 RepID=T1G4V9_HELRO
RRKSHVTYEQKRRFSIRCGLDTLNLLTPNISESHGGRVSKATTLHKAVEFVRKLKSERQDHQDAIDQLRLEVQMHEKAIRCVHSQLPATGLPTSAMVARSKVNLTKDMFYDFVDRRSRDNWKFKIFGLLAEPLFSSYDEVVCTVNEELFNKSVHKWLSEHCSLTALRPILSNSLRKLCTSTCILTDPALFQRQIISEINSSNNNNNNK